MQFFLLQVTAYSLEVMQNKKTVINQAIDQ